MQKDRNTEKRSNIQTSVTHLKMSCDEDQKIFGQNQHQPVYTILTMRCEFEIFSHTHMGVNCKYMGYWQIFSYTPANCKYMGYCRIIPFYFFYHTSVGSNCKYMGYWQIGVRIAFCIWICILYLDFVSVFCSNCKYIYGILTDWGQDDQSAKVFLTWTFLVAIKLPARNYQKYHLIFSAKIQLEIPFYEFAKIKLLFSLLWWK